MKIETGQGTIPLITLLGIWSISALNALPGLAVSPILGQMSTIFPHSSEFDIQLLSSLPSLLTIPFILLSGKLTERINNIVLLQVGLIIFALSGLLYMLSSRMWQLIAVSALLGIGSGMIVPLSTGLISRHFIGRYRTRQFGLSSAITNITLVTATVLTGYLAEINWHLPFIVYFFPVVSFFLSFYLKRDTISVAPVKVTVSGKIEVKRLVSLMLFYGLVTYLAVIVPGFILNRVLSIFGSFTKCVSLLCMAGGMVLILLSGNEWILGLGAIFIGFGYGVMQPVIYDQTTRVATPDKVTLALAFVMSMNYLAILLCPTIIDTLQSLFHIHTQQFAFIFNLVITLLVVLGAYYLRHTFLFNDSCDSDKSLEKL